MLVHANGTFPLHKHSLNSQNNQRFECKPRLLQGKGVVCIEGKISRLKFSRSEENPWKLQKFCPAKISHHTVLPNVTWAVLVSPPPRHMQLLILTKNETSNSKSKKLTPATIWSLKTVVMFLHNHAKTFLGLAYLTRVLHCYSCCTLDNILCFSSKAFPIDIHMSWRYFQSLDYSLWGICLQYIFIPLLEIPQYVNLVLYCLKGWGRWVDTGYCYLAINKQNSTWWTYFIFNDDGGVDERCRLCKDSSSNGKVAWGLFWLAKSCAPHCST